MFRQYTPSYEKARHAYIQNFAYTGEEYPDERLTFPLAIISEYDYIQEDYFFDDVAKLNGY